MKILVIGAAIVALAIPAVAGAVPVFGTQGDDVLIGTNARDDIRGFAGNDRLLGRGGADRLRLGLGVDIAFGMRGNDRVFALDIGPGNKKDFVNCGAGRRDRVVAFNPQDKFVNCELFGPVLN